MKGISKIISIISVLCLSVSSMPFSTTAEDVETNFTSNDAIWCPMGDSEDYERDELATYANVKTDSHVDNSELDYFPPIGNQGKINSCAGWATTYYQFTYEVNRYRNIATDSSNIYSPSWTYNYINGGENVPTYLDDAYKILEYHGAMKLKDYTYNPNKYSYEWSTNTQKMTEALHYRIKYYTEKVSSSDDLSTIKQLIASGKIATVWINIDSAQESETTTTEGEKIYIRGKKNEKGGHFMTIVGYDDNIKVKITHNNKTEYMIGAFKVANSWGYEEYGNDGFIWVAYDALNKYTSLTNGWDDDPKTRDTIFGVNNQMTFVDVVYRPVYFAGKVQYSTDDPWGTTISACLGPVATFEKFKPAAILNPPILGTTKTKEIVFDYFENATYMDDYQLTSLISTKVSNTRCSNMMIKCAVMDSSCNIIIPNTEIGYLNNSGFYSRTTKLNLAKGRLTHYDNANINDSDIQFLTDYLLGEKNMSTLQHYLADMDNSGTLNVFDLVMLKQAYENQYSKSLSLTDYMPELGCTMAEFIERETDEGYESFINEYSNELVAANISY